ncbi:hypothetical protein I5U23_08020 [Stenotrophomonas maltophilia]|nr:hypothetical protein [Stenotrophomonas maltophilia]
MSNDKTILADVQPGGRVRLGDARRQWLEVRGLAVGIVKNLQAFADSPHKDAWCGALDDALSFADQIEKDAAAAYEATLAARQPAGEPMVVAHRYIQRHQSAEHSVWLNGDADETYVEAERQGLGRIERAYAAPAAQQPAQVYLDGLDRALGEVIDQRDRYHEVADELAARIAAITGVDIGEHSSANCPWQNAIEAAEEYKPTQAVDLSSLVSELAEADREYAEAKKKYHTVSAKMSAAGVRASCMAAYEREITAKARLDAAIRALIDSQAVGNG